MEPIRKKPARVAPFPPPGYVKAQPVTPWDDWWTLQPLLQTEDPWDLIFFNFKTYSSKNQGSPIWYSQRKITLYIGNGSNASTFYNDRDPWQRNSFLI